MVNDHVLDGINGTPQFYLPLIFWTNDSVYRAYKISNPWVWDKRSVSRMNTYCDTMRILDASGKSFNVARLEEVYPADKIEKFFRKLSWNTRVIPIIVSQKQLNLDQFKKEVKRAVSARQRHDFDGNILAETMKKLPYATNYIEAIDSLPKLI